MRLIDKDLILKTATDKEWGLWCEIANIKFAPEVDAIPVEWLRKERDKNKGIAEKFSKEDLDIDFISKYMYNRASHKVLMIEELLLDWRNWEKENEQNKESTSQSD